MNTLFVGHNLLKFSFLSSTNDYCWELLSDKSLPDGTVVWTPLQTQGKGKGVNHGLPRKESHYLSALFLNLIVNISKQYF